MRYSWTYILYTLGKFEFYFLEIAGTFCLTRGKAHATRFCRFVGDRSDMGIEIWFVVQDYSQVFNLLGPLDIETSEFSICLDGIQWWLNRIATVNLIVNLHWIFKGHNPLGFWPRQKPTLIICNIFCVNGIFFFSSIFPILYFFSHNILNFLIRSCMYKV